MLRGSRLLRCSLLAITLCQATAWAQDPQPAIDLVPSDAIICVEVSRPREILDLLTGENMTDTVTSLPFYRNLSSNEGFTEFLNVVRLFEISLNTQWREALTTFTGGGITFAVCPGDTVLFIVDVVDEGLLRRAHELLVTMVRADARSKGLPDRVETAEFMGVSGWSFNGNEAHAIIGNRLIFPSNPKGLKRVLELRATTESASLASRGDYQKAQEAAGAEAAARAFLNLAPFKLLPGPAKLLEQDKSNPLAALFLSGIIEAARNSNWLWLGLGVEGNGLSLRALVDGQASGPDTPAAFAQPTNPEQGAMPNLSVPRRIATLSFYRDLYGFYSAKDELFPERTSQLIFFENMMGIFFTGRDLTSEVLIETNPELRFVVAQEQHDPAQEPAKAQMPAFAAILRLRDTEKFDEVVEEAWQKAVGLVNFTQGQQGMPGLVIDRPVHNGTKFTVAGLSTAGLDDPNAHHNLRPSLAMPEDYLILSSTDGLARDLIDVLTAEAKGPRTPLTGIHSMAELDGEQLASILEANRAGLARQNMVKKGHTQEEAEAEIRLLLALASIVSNAELRVGISNDLTEARLIIALALEQHQSP